jgi:REP element-mobilizing transposase RayT
MVSQNEQLYPDKYYHVYNHGNGNDNIFLNEENYNYFLKHYTFFINPVADTLAYCLMPNHFHFVIHIKNENEIQELLAAKTSKEIELYPDKFPVFISKQFSNFFNSYSKAFNKAHDRNGKLFRIPFRRKLLNTDAYLLKAIHYVHANPVHHSFVKDMRDWSFSSINAYESTKKSHIAKKRSLQLFGGIEGFRIYHKQSIDAKYKIEMAF